MVDERVTRAITQLCIGLDFHTARHTTAGVQEQLLLPMNGTVFRVSLSPKSGHAGRDGAMVTAVDNRNGYLPQKRAALEAWAGHILGLGTEPLATKCDRTNSAVRQHSELSAQLQQYR